MTVGTVLLCLALLAGCKFLTRTNVDFDTDSISKTQKIVICDAAGNEKAAITGEREIDAFVEAMDAERWKIEEVPEGLTEAGSRHGPHRPGRDEDGANLHPPAVRGRGVSRH